jgi:hypothetical protein
MEAIIAALLTFMLLEIWTEWDQWSQTFTALFILFTFLTIRLVFFLAASDLEEKERRLQRKRNTE